MVERGHKVASKSAQIRQMSAEGMTRGQIAKALDIRFQFVYNVLKNEENKSLLRQLKAEQGEKNEG